MPRALSSQALNALMSQHTDDAFIILVTFSHLPDVFRCALNTEDVVSNGNTYTATYFEISLPEENDRGPQGCQVVVDNVDRRLVDLLRSITTPLDVVVQVVLASQPDVVEMEFKDLVLREAQWDAQKITGILVSEDPLNQSFPSHIYAPRNFAGIY